MSIVQGLIGLAIVAVALWAAVVLVLWLHRPSRELVVPAIRILPDVLRLIGRLIRDRETPLRVRVALVVLAVWLASPIDLIPEFLPGIGSLDDLVAAAVILGWAGRRLGREHLWRRWPGSPEGFAVLERMLRW